MSEIFKNYQTINGAVDEFITEGGRVRPDAERIVARLVELGADELTLRETLVGAAFLQGGVT
ncbi:MAG: hypothetical protein AAF658_05975, partial [Myxococcota bacterium]